MTNDSWGLAGNGKAGDWYVGLDQTLDNEKSELEIEIRQQYRGPGGEYRFDLGSHDPKIVINDLISALKQVLEDLQDESEDGNN